MGICRKTFVSIGSLALLACTLCMLIVVALPHQAQAAEKLGKGVYYFETYTSHYKAGTTDTLKVGDINGDKKKDKIEFVINKKAGTTTEEVFVIDENGDNVYNDDGTMKTEKKAVPYYTETGRSLKVNGKTVKTWKDSDSIGISLYAITLGNGKTFLQIGKSKTNTRWGITYSKLYTVKKNKLKTVASYKKLFNTKVLNTKNGFDESELEPEKIKGNTIYFNVSLDTKAMENLYAKTFNGVTKSFIKLKYKGGKFKVQTAAMKVNCGALPIYTRTAAKKIKTTKKVGSSKKGVTIAKGKTFRVLKLSVVKKNFYVQVKASNGKTGWVKLGKTRLTKSQW